MAISPEDGLKPSFLYSEGYGLRFVNLMENATLSLTDFQHMCTGGKLNALATDLAKKRKKDNDTPRDARRREVRLKLLTALSKWISVKLQESY